MKLTFLLITIGFLQLKAETYAQKITVVAKKATVTDVIAQIRKQTDYDFLYNNETLKDAKLITVDAQNMDFSKVLVLCFGNQPFDYMIRNKTILIIDKPEPEAVSPLLTEVAARIGGVVRDATTGAPLIGVNISIERTATGTTTDAQGAFTLDVPGPSSVLLVSYLGYETQRVTVGNKTVLDIKMVKVDTKLAEIVVVGYGTRTKGAITGAISTVKSEVFENRPVLSTADALQGAIPGLTITRASGQPGANTFELKIRGYSTINANGASPLILVDGIPGDLNTINTNDIAEVSVLKDAAAAIYGARAADGVIIVTTKKGRRGSAPEVTYTLNYGIKTPTYLRKIQNTLQFAEFMDEGFRNVGIAGFAPAVFDKIKAGAAPELGSGWNYGLSNYPSFYGYTDWNKVIYKNTTQQMHSVAVSGGGENTNYLISLGYNRNGGIVNYGTNNSDLYNLRINYDFRLSKKLSVETRTSFDNTATIEPTLLGSALTNVTRQYPYQPVYNPLGQFYGYQGYENPAQYLEEGGNYKSNSSRFATNFKVDYSIIPGLKLTAQAAVRMNYGNGSTTNPTITRYTYTGSVQDIRNTPNSAKYDNSKSLNKLYQIYLDYNKDFAVDHNINFTAGASLEQSRSEGQTTFGYNFASNDIYTLNLADRTKVAYANFTGSISTQSLASYFSRLSYSYKGKYVLDLTARADGSSKFAPEKRWSAVFPSAAFAYNLSKEKFIESLNIFDQLKLRLSIGKMGNQELGALGVYGYIPLISVGGVYPIGSPNAGLPGAVANPASIERTWETITNKNIGLDVAVLNSRLSFSFDYYNKINNNMLVNVAVPVVFGATPPSTNQGKLVTKGFESSVTWRDNIKDFRYSVSLQLSDSKNQLVELKNTDSYAEGLNFTRKGYAIYSYFGYVYDGIIQTQAQLDKYKLLQGVPARIALGDVMYKDLDGDGKLTAFGDKTKGLDGDMTYLGNLTPRYTFSSNINVGYKNFDLQVFLQGVGKRDVVYQGNIARPNTSYWPSLALFYNQTWTPARQDAQFPRYVPLGVGYDDVANYDYRTSTKTLQNVAYLRFKVITLSYALPSVVTNTLKIKSARIYVSGQDLFTISKGTYGGNFDPEDGYRNEGTYPFNKVYSMGLNVKF
ncbi:SusC/RagA family TonB-linked outer membrane protein [Mucilaginibacter sp. UYCu711]|uniref:SusC/RagA family TonB-linked outer membrane protein n=1 Tax=Mucilaginibacter sp. UYCu711 TaxID=3156339 RepID=UPI003D1E6C01